MSPVSAQYFDCDLPEPVAHALAGGTACVFTARCPGSEGPNEDAAAVVSIGNGSGVLLVADGMGGGNVGEEASMRAISEVEAAVSVLAATTDDDMLRSAILNGIENANQSIRTELNGAGTTVAAVEIVNGAIRPYHVGDSMIVVVGGRGKIKHQTIAHSPTGYGVEAGLIEELDAIHHEDRHLVSNYVGSATMHIAIGPTITLAQRDTVLVASDGLGDNVHLHEIAEHLRKGPLDKALQRIVVLARSRMEKRENGTPSKPDDLTVVAFRLNRSRKSAAPRTPAKESEPPTESAAAR